MHVSVVTTGGCAKQQLGTLHQGAEGGAAGPFGLVITWQHATRASNLEQAAQTAQTAQAAAAAAAALRTDHVQWSDWVKIKTDDTNTDSNAIWSAADHSGASGGVLGLGPSDNRSAFHEVIHAGQQERAEDFICLEGKCVVCAQPSLCVNKSSCETLCDQDLKFVCLRGECVPYATGLPLALCSKGCGPA